MLSRVTYAMTATSSASNCCRAAGLVLRRPCSSLRPGAGVGPPPAAGGLLEGLIVAAAAALVAESVLPVLDMLPAADTLPAQEMYTPQLMDDDVHCDGQPMHHNAMRWCSTSVLSRSSSCCQMTHLPMGCHDNHATVFQQAAIRPYHSTLSLARGCSSQLILA
jgi:hypothetical protein